MAGKVNIVRNIEPNVINNEKDILLIDMIRFFVLLCIALPQVYYHNR